MTPLEMIAVALVILLFMANYVELFQLRREVRNSRDRLLSLQGEFFTLKRRLEDGLEIPMSVEPGLYTQKVDPITGKKEMVKTEAVDNPWADILNEDKTVHDILSEMMERQATRG